MIRLLGKHVTVKLPGHELKGKVVEETANTAVIETVGGLKRIIKHNSVFIIDGEKTKGKSLVGRHDERLKKWLKKTR